ncbi:rhodanese-like domain-containing protein [Aestuariibius sp. 2305UL40-4]|uniref:rhodanese-like domain-containing protein n=1 Tax=Aestuariibius violaceus TaxID=3234132 RepID=UPI00345E7D6C
MQTDRRTFLIGGAALLGGTAILWQSGGAGASGAVMTPDEAYRAVNAGEILLVDIRRPDEWTATGIAEGAVPIDMRRDDFLTSVAAAANGRPVAIICARGVRSRRLAARMAAAGLTDVIDIPEGMLGSPAGPGWITRDLPISVVTG